MRYFLILITFFLMAGCSAFSPNEPARYPIEVQNITLDLPQGTHVREGILRVSMPRAAIGLDETHIQVQQPDGSLLPIANAVWADAPTRMLEPILIHGFETSGLFSAVVDSRAPVDPTFDLETYIEKFTFMKSPQEQEGHVDVVLRFTLIDLVKNKVLSSQFVVISEPVQVLRLTYIVPAFEKALGHALDNELRDIRELHWQPSHGG